MTFKIVGLTNASAAEREASIQLIFGVSFVDSQYMFVHQFWHFSLRRERESHNENVDILKTEYGWEILISRLKMLLFSSYRRHN